MYGNRNGYNNQGGYNNNRGYNNNNGYNNNRGYNDGGYNNNQPKPIYKSSGATYSKITYAKSGRPESEQHFYGHFIVNAWRKVRGGLMLAKVTPYAGQNGKGLEEVHSEKADYQKMLCTITNTQTGQSQIYHVLMNIKTHVIVIDALSLCITPNGSGTTRSGKHVKGYFGRNFKK